jgi:hypothetical protein
VCARGVSQHPCRSPSRCSCCCALRGPLPLSFRQVLIHGRPPPRARPGGGGAFCGFRRLAGSRLCSKVSVAAEALCRATVVCVLVRRGCSIGIEGGHVLISIPAQLPDALRQDRVTHDLRTVRRRLPLSIAARAVEALLHQELPTHSTLSAECTQHPTTPIYLCTRANARRYTHTKPPQQYACCHEWPRCEQQCCPRSRVRYHPAPIFARPAAPRLRCRGAHTQRIHPDTSLHRRRHLLQEAPRSPWSSGPCHTAIQSAKTGMAQ